MNKMQVRKQQLHVCFFALQSTQPGRQPFPAQGYVDTRFCSTMWSERSSEGTSFAHPASLPQTSPLRHFAIRTKLCSRVWPPL